MGSIIVGKRRFYDDVDDSHCAIDLFIFYVSAVLYAPFCAYLNPDVHIFAVPVLLLIPHGLVVDADCTTSMMTPTTEWCDLLIFSHVRALLYAPFFCTFMNPMCSCTVWLCH